MTKGRLGKGTKEDEKLFRELDLGEENSKGDLET